MVVEGFVAVGFPAPVLREPRAVVEALVDARAGEGRYVESDALGVLVEHLGSGTFVNGTVHPTAARSTAANATATPATTAEASVPVATGTALSVDDETTSARYVAVFASMAAASVDHLDRDPFADWKDFEASIDGRVVVVEGTLDTTAVV